MTTAIDLFAGAGGFTCGAGAAGVPGAATNDGGDAMTAATRAALAAHLRACGRDGPPPGPGLWVLGDDHGVDAVDVREDGGGPAW